MQASVFAHAQLSRRAGRARALGPRLAHRGPAAEAGHVHWGSDDVKTVWPSGLRRWLQAPVRKGVGSNPTAVTLSGDDVWLSPYSVLFPSSPQETWP